jgi:hypothetical protein
MSIVNNIKIISPSPREKNVHFRHATPLPENTLCHTYMPPQWQLRVTLAVLNDLMQVQFCYISPKCIRTDRRYNGTHYCPVKIVTLAVLVHWRQGAFPA